MRNLICKDCKSTDVTVYTPGIFGDSRHRCNSCGKISFTADFVEPTLFDSVTASPDVLADKLVYDWGHLCHNGDVKIYWKSTILPDAVFYSKYEAIAATLEELNKVSK